MIQNIITIFLQYCNCKWKASCLYYKTTMDTVYQTQCQRGTREKQCIRWPPDMSDLILTLGSVLMAWIYCPTIYIFLIFYLKWNLWKVRGWVFLKLLMHFPDWQSLFVFHREVAKKKPRNIHINISQTDNETRFCSKQTIPANLPTKQTISFHWSRNWLIALYLLTMLILTANYNSTKNTTSFIPGITLSEMSQQQWSFLPTLLPGIT